MTDYAPTYKIAFSRMATGKLEPGDTRWGQFTTSFANHELTILEIMNKIFLGHAYCAWLKGDRRNAENFEMAQHIAIDLDTEDERSDPDALLNHTLVAAYGGMIHPTPSHTDDKPRCRVIFFLDEPITTGEGYRKAYETVASFFDGADTVCKDPARFFYGARDRVPIVLNRDLPVAHVRTWYKRMGKSQTKTRALAVPDASIVRLEDYRRRDATTPSSEGLIARLVNKMLSAPPKTRNNTLNEIAFLAGKMAAKGEIEAGGAEMEIKAAARQMGQGQVEIMKTFNSGFNAGQKAVG